jgi:outer membrane protein W
MKNDKLDAKLRDKLGQMSVEPPARVWERIERGLAAASSAAEAEEVGAVRVKSLRRRVVSWSAAAAACLLAGVISLSILDKPGPEAPVAVNTPIKTEAAQPLTADNPVTDAAAQDNPQEPNTPIAAQHQTKRRPESPTIPDAAARHEDEEPAPIAAGSSDDDTQRNAPEAAENPGTESMEYKTRDMDEQRFPVTDRELRAEDAPQYPARRRVPVSASLFAANFGGVNFGGDVMGNTRVAGETPGQSNSAVKMRHKMPLTLGVNVSYGLTDRLSVETGLLYTYLYSESETTKSSEGRFEQKLHYLGIPVTVRYDIWNYRAIKIYASVGGTIEKCIDAREINKYSFRPAETELLDAAGFQLSVGAAAGIQIRLDRTFGLYLEPGLNYFFDSPKQPESYRTQNPLSFSVKAGLRINLR